MAAAFMGRDSAAAVAVPCGQPEPLLTLAARNAFWPIQLPTLQQFVVEVRSAVATGTLFDVLYSLVAHILGATDQQTLDIVRSRCVAKVSTSAEALLSLDAGLDLFTKSDQADLRKEQDQVRSATTFAKDFAAEYKARHRSLGLPEPKAKAKAKALSRQRGSDWCHPRAPARVPEGFIEHADAALLLPPRGTIWRMLRVGGWQCHQKPFPRVSFTFARWGARGASMLCAQHCWRLFLADEGLGESRCPIEGVFDEVFEPIAAWVATPGFGNYQSTVGPQRARPTHHASKTSLYRSSPMFCNGARLCRLRASMIMVGGPTHLHCFTGPCVSHRLPEMRLGPQWFA